MRIVLLFLLGCTEEESADTSVKPPCTVCQETFKGQDYYFSDERVVFSEANRACKNLGLNLVTVSDAEENDWLFITAADYDMNVRWWIGYTDRDLEGHFSWIEGESDYTNWDIDQPDNSGDNQDCTVFVLGGAKWDDWKCTVSARFICK